MPPPRGGRTSRRRTRAKEGRRRARRGEEGEEESPAARTRARLLRRLPRRALLLLAPRRALLPPSSGLARPRDPTALRASTAAASRSAKGCPRARVCANTTAALPAITASTSPPSQSSATTVSPRTTNAFGAAPVGLDPGSTGASRSARTSTAARPRRRRWTRGTRARSTRRGRGCGRRRRRRRRARRRRGGVRLHDEGHRLPARRAGGHRGGRRRRAAGPVRGAADFGRVVVQALARADHAPGEAELHGGVGRARRGGRHRGGRSRRRARRRGAPSRGGERGVVRFEHRTSRHRYFYNSYPPQMRLSDPFCAAARKARRGAHCSHNDHTHQLNAHSASLAMPHSEGPARRGAHFSENSSARSTAMRRSLRSVQGRPRPIIAGPTADADALARPRSPPTTRRAARALREAADAAVQEARAREDTASPTTADEDPDQPDPKKPRPPRTHKSTASASARLEGTASGAGRSSRPIAVAGSGSGAGGGAVRAPRGTGGSSDHGLLLSPNWERPRRQSASLVKPHYEGLHPGRSAAAHATNEKIARKKQIARRASASRVPVLNPETGRKVGYRSPFERAMTGASRSRSPSSPRRPGAEAIGAVCGGV